MNGYSTYNGGMTVGVTPFNQTSSRTGEFISGAQVSSTTNPGNQNARTLQQSNPGEYRPSSVLTPLTSNPNGQSSNTFERNRALNLYRQ